jgi:hypothetical protein
MRTKVDTDPGPGSGPDGVLAQLAAVRRQRADVERREAGLVRRARNEGIVWEQIAASLGVSKQAVHRKYAGRNALRRRGATLSR